MWRRFKTFRVESKLTSQVHPLAPLSGGFRACHRHAAIRHRRRGPVARGAPPRGRGGQRLLRGGPSRFRAGRRPGRAGAAGRRGAAVGAPLRAGAGGCGPSPGQRVPRHPHGRAGLPARSHLHRDAPSARCFRRPAGRGRHLAGRLEPAAPGRRPAGHSRRLPDPGSHPDRPGRLPARRPAVRRGHDPPGPRHARPSPPWQKDST